MPFHPNRTGIDCVDSLITEVGVCFGELRGKFADRLNLSAETTSVGDEHELTVIYTAPEQDPVKVVVRFTAKETAKLIGRWGLVNAFLIEVAGTVIVDWFFNSQDLLFNFNEETQQAMVNMDRHLSSVDVDLTYEEEVLDKTPKTPQVFASPSPDPVPHVNVTIHLNDQLYGTASEVGQVVAVLEKALQEHLAANPHPINREKSQVVVNVVHPESGVGGSIDTYRQMLREGLIDMRPLRVSLNVH